MNADTKEIMTFDRLQQLLSDWYEVPPNELGLPANKIPEQINPILKDFYTRFGTLAERKSQFTHPQSQNGPLSGQDHIFSVDKLKSKDGITVFGDENQNVFVVAASNDPSDTDTYSQGDAVFQDRTTKMTKIGAPLHECLIICVLRETIMSVEDRFRQIQPKGLKAALETVKTGDTIKSRYIWPDVTLTFYLSKNIWFMDWDDMQFAAHRGQWKSEPATWQEPEFKSGGGW